MKLAVTYPDQERYLIDLLASLLAAETPVPTVGLRLPAGWKSGSVPHVQVTLDGSADLHPVAERSTMRVVVWAATPTTAKALAQLARGLLLAEDHIRPGTGMIPALDPDHNAELASFTVLVTARSTPILSGS